MKTNAANIATLRSPSRLPTSVPPASGRRWSKDKVLAEARKRTRRIDAVNQAKVLKMLGGMLVEAGWSEDDFIEALVQDVQSREGRR